MNYVDHFLEILFGFGQDHDVVWDKAVIVNIFKEGDEANRTSTDDYRGIALISCLGKLYLSIWARRITRHAEKRLDKQQGGFTSRRSSTRPSP